MTLMKVHFFDFDGNFVRTEEMPRDRVRENYREAIQEPLRPALEMPGVQPELLRLTTRTYSGIPIFRYGEGRRFEVFYLYLENPGKTVQILPKPNTERRAIKIDL